MGMLISVQKGPKSEINITPYIDILLVLLIIFMVVTPVRQKDLKVKTPAPQPPDVKIEAPSNTIVVSVGEHAQIEINRVPTNIAALGAKLREIYSARSNKNMFIRASARLPYGDVVRIIDISKGAGVGEIGLITEEMH